MTELQVFALFVLPLGIAAVAILGGYLEKRRQDRHHHTPAE